MVKKIDFTWALWDFNAGADYTRKANMGYARSRTKTVIADGTANQTAWCSMKRGGMVTLEGTFVGTVTLERRGADQNVITATNNSGVAITFAAAGTYELSPGLVQAEYRLNMKSGGYTSGTCIMLIEGL